MIFNILAGILGGAAIFAATLFSIYQAAIHSGRLRFSHLSSALLTVAGAATVSWLLPKIAMIVGILLVVSAAIAAACEHRWNRVFPIFQILFGLALIIGLPFA